MNSFLKVMVVLLVSTHAFADVSVVEFNDMKTDILNMQQRWANGCGHIAKKNHSAQPRCYKDMEETKGINFCLKQLELYSQLAEIVSAKNVTTVESRFAASPAPDALGGVLLWQMKNTIQQSNSTWLRSLNSLKQKDAACIQQSGVTDRLIDRGEKIKEFLDNVTLIVDVK